MGQSESTAGANRAAVRLYDAYRVRRGKLLFAQMRMVEIEQDNLETELFHYQVWLASTPIPCYFDDDLNPRRSQNADEDAPVKVLNATTLAKYVGKVINEIRHKFPTHPDFAGLKPEEVPSWWTRDRKSFEQECSDNQRRMAGSEYFVGQMETRPLYSDNGAVGYDGVLDAPISDYISVIDLQYILKKLFGAATLDGFKEGKLQQRAWIALCFHATGRSGEVKFVDTADFMFHPRYDVLDPKWTEAKTRSKYSCPLVPNVVSFGFLSDTIHVIASFFLVERGLFRHGADQLAIASFLFPDLHGYKDNGVAKKLTNIIRENLPDGCPKTIKDSFSGKSLREGSITELMVHRQTTTLDVCGRSGHSTGTTLDAYVDKSFVFRGLRGAKALAHFKDIDTETKMPRLECLGPHTADAVAALVESLFVVSVPSFLPGGSLHIVLRICAASLVMYHEKVTEQFSPANAVATHLRNAAREAKITDSRFPVTGEFTECMVRYHYEGLSNAQSGDITSPTKLGVNCQCSDISRRQSGRLDGSIGNVKSTRSSEAAATLPC